MQIKASDQKVQHDCLLLCTSEMLREEVLQLTGRESMPREKELG